jgi:hypothetical protein
MELTDDKELLHAKLKVKNAGRGLMKLTKLRVDLYRVRPVDQETRAKIESGDLVRPGSILSTWPPIAQHVQEWGHNRPEIEPDEYDEFGCDFIVDGAIETVYLYLYLENVTKKRGTRELGWTVSTFYELAGSSGSQSSANLVLEETS